MAKVFNINAITERTKLASNGTGEISFTVTNTTNHPLRGRISVVPLQGTQSDWLSVEGEMEREFGAEGSHQFTIRIGVPRDKTPEGQYPFRIDAVSVANPQEDFTEGPQSWFEVPPPPPESKPFPWWIVAVAAMVLLVGGVVGYQILKDDAMPNLVGESFEEAKQTLITLGVSENSITNDSRLTNEISEFHKVIEQVPDKGEPLPSDEDSVILTIGEPAMPSLIGETYTKNLTTQFYTDYGIEIRKKGRSTNNQNEFGKVIGQKPHEGARLLVGDKKVGVIVYVGDAKTVTVPYVMGKSLDDAKAHIRANDLIVGTIKSESQSKHKNKKPGTIVRVDPSQGQKVKVNTKVNLVYIPSRRRRIDLIPTTQMHKINPKLLDTIN